MLKRTKLTVLPDNECGECRECCYYLPIPEIDKPSGTPCKHLCDAGCGLHATPVKPDTCKLFLCGWRSIGWLGKKIEWRPDKLGVIFNKGTLNLLEATECCNITEVKPGAIERAASTIEYIKQTLRFPGLVFCEVPYSIVTNEDYDGRHSAVPTSNGDFVCEV